RLEGNGRLGFHFAGRFRAGAPSAAAPPLAAEDLLESAAAAPAAEHVAENLRGHFRIALKLKSTTRRPFAPVEAARSRSRPRSRAGEAELIVLRAAFLVTQHVVGFLHFLEARFRLLVAGVAVGVILARELAVSLLDLILAGATLDTERFVVVAGPGRSGCCGC